ncbi:MAG: hypothetical protein ACM3ME_09725 [Chloroflexota bacterium]
MQKRSYLVIFCFFTISILYGQDKDMVRYYIQTNQGTKARSLLCKELNSKNITADRTFILAKMYINESKDDSATAVLNTFNQTIEEQRLLKVIGLSLIDMKKTSDYSDVTQKMVRELRAFKSSKSAIVKLEAAFVLAQLDKKDDAWELIEQACNLKTDSAETFVSAGDIYSRLSILLKDNSLYGKACGRYEQALLVNPRYLPALTALSRAYIGSRNFIEARQKLRDALAVDSTWLPGLQLMGELQYDLGNYKLASKYYTQFVNSIKPGKQQLQKYAYILYFNQEHEKAQNIIQSLLIDDPNNRVLLRLLSYTSCELKQGDKGLQAMQKFMRIGAADSLRLLSSDYEYYGRLLSMQSLDSLAIPNYILAAKLDTAKASIYEYMAKSYEKLKKFPEAVRAYDSVIIIDKNASSTIWFSKGRNCLLWADLPEVKADTAFHSKILREAVASFTRVTELSSNSHLGYLWKGRSLAGLDPETTKGLAEESYRKAIEILEAKNQNEKYKAELIEAYSYMGYLSYLKFEPAFKTDKNQAQIYKIESLGYWNKILALDSTNTAAIQAIKALK